MVQTDVSKQGILSQNSRAQRLFGIAPENRKYQQQQQKVFAKQEQERQKLQRKPDGEDQRLQRQNADQARGQRGTSNRRSRCNNDMYSSSGCRKDNHGRPKGSPEFSDRAFIISEFFKSFWTQGPTGYTIGNDVGGPHGPTNASLFRQ